MMDFAFHVLETKIYSGDPKFKQYWTLAGSPDLAVLRKQLSQELQKEDIEELGRKFDLLTAGLPIGRVVLRAAAGIASSVGSAAQREARKAILKLALEFGEPKLLKPNPGAGLVRGAEEGAPILRRVPDPSRGAWGYVDHLERGRLLEPQLGKNTPRGFPYIDDWSAATGRAVSAKTVDLTGKLKTVENSLRAAVRQIAHFPPRVEKKGFLQHDGVTIYLRDIRSRSLRIGVEPGTRSSATEEMFSRIREYAKEQGLAGIEIVEAK
jgi:hypothetical protein